ncbi:hypothetical protein QQF64_009457 [Cirrhinus molitorella]|uniref:Uncharacterized protein n=1 Tax=Cirrhinus molitorella TaxID=172907 RepID=A0ABR3M2R4_9TELE
MLEKAITGGCQSTALSEVLCQWAQVSPVLILQRGNELQQTEMSFFADPRRHTAAMTTNVQRDQRRGWTCSVYL